MKKSFNMFMTSVLLVSLCADLQSFAASYYVALPPVGDDGNSGTKDSPFATIQKALDKKPSWNDTVWVNSGTYKIDRELMPSSVGFLVRSVSGNPADVVIDAQGKCRCFATNTGGYNNYLLGLTFINGVADNGGGVKLGSNGTIDDCVISNCMATADGGGLYGSSLTRVSGTRIVDCSARVSGGGVRLVGGKFTGTKLNFISNCVAVVSGGGIHGTDNIVSIANVEVVDCQAKTAGGIYAIGSTTAWSTNVILRCCRAISTGGTDGGGADMRNFTLSDYVVTDCHAVNTGTGANVKTEGGGLYLYNSTLTNSVVTGCSAGSSVATQNPGYEKGGGISTYYYDGAARKLKPQIVCCVVRDCCVSNGAAKTIAALGGGIGGDSAGLLIENCDVSGNRADVGGGGIYCAQAATIRNCTVTNNVCVPLKKTDLAFGGSGIRASGASTIDSCLVAGNVFDKDSTSYNGGGSAVWLGEKGKLVNSAVIGNTGSRSVAFQWAGCGNVLVSNCLFKANRGLLTTNSGRGGVFMLYNMTADCFVTDCRFIDNECPSDHASLMNIGLSSTADATLYVRNCLITGTKGKDLIWANAGTDATKYFGKLAIENCTIVSNKVTSGEMIVPYYENASYITRDRVFVKGSVILFNNGKNAFNGGYKDSTNVTYSCAETIGTQGGNVVYDASKPLFTDLANGNFRPAEGSQLMNVVPKADWMGDGTKRSKLDLGTGYELQTTGGYGTKVVWTDARPRIFGDLADIGCCEYYLQPGLILLFR